MMANQMNVVAEHSYIEVKRIINKKIPLS